MIKYYIIIIIIVVFLLYVLNNIDNDCVCKYEKERFVLDKTFKANIWAQEPSIITHPELCSPNIYGNRIPDINKVSIAIGGGGSRAFSAAMGYFRALNRMGYKNKAQYVSTVSGGTWFYSLYCFCQTNPKFTDSAILGISSGLDNGIPNPLKMTMSNLRSDNSNNNLYFGNMLRRTDILDYFIDGFYVKNVKLDRVFNYAIGKYFLEPYGLNNEVPVALNKKHAEDILRRNSNTAPPLYLPDNSPFWICNTTLMFNYIQQYPYVNVPMTPLYSGLSQIITKNNNTIGGVVIESFAFGNTNPPASIDFNINAGCLNPTMKSLNSINNFLTLRDMVTASSCAFILPIYSPNVFSPILNELLPSSAKKLITDYNIWGTSGLIPTNSDSQCTLNLFNNTCDVPYGYDKNSCTKYLQRCYSNTQEQCSKDSDCEYDITKLQCVNNIPNHSDLNCRLTIPYGCKCIEQDIPYTTPIPQELYSQTTKITDGGFSDMFGILSLLSRNVKHIIVFQNTSGTALDYSDNCDLSALFGKCDITKCQPAGQMALNTVKVFKENEWENNIVKKFIACQKTGGPIFARTNLEVLPNLDNGVSGGYIVDILFIMIFPASKRFLDNLPKEILNQINVSSVLFGDFYGFPAFPFIMQNYSLGLLSALLDQTNFLSSYTDWCMNQPELKVHIDEMFNY